jgi:hypothetical protein
MDREVNARRYYRRRLWIDMLADMDTMRDQSTGMSVESSTYRRVRHIETRRIIQLMFQTSSGHNLQRLLVIFADGQFHSASPRNRHS